MTVSLTCCQFWTITSKSFGRYASPSSLHRRRVAFWGCDMLCKARSLSLQTQAETLGIEGQSWSAVDQQYGTQQESAEPKRKAKGKVKSNTGFRSHTPTHAQNRWVWGERASSARRICDVLQSCCETSQMFSPADQGFCPLWARQKVNHEGKSCLPKPCRWRGGLDSTNRVRHTRSAGSGPAFHTVQCAGRSVCSITPGLVSNCAVQAEVS